MNDYNLHLGQKHLGSCMKFEDETRARLKDKKCLEYYGFKVYSQNDEDGIIEEIFNRIGTTNKTFIEFGVENGLECNSHYLLFKNWHGLWIDGGETHVRAIREKFAPVLANGQLKVLQAFITRENINELFIEGGIEGEIDLLSIDVDGNDYYIWQAINVVKPRVVIIEYNAKFPPNCDWKMAYNKNHHWDGSDWQGASLKSLELLGRELGYQLVATNFTGVNAFFVRKESAGGAYLLNLQLLRIFSTLRVTNLFLTSIITLRDIVWSIRRKISDCSTISRIRTRFRCKVFLQKLTLKIFSATL